MNTDQVRELLYQALETERGSIEVYRTAIRCALNEDLKEEWEEYLEQTDSTPRCCGSSMAHSQFAVLWAQTDAPRTRRRGADIPPSTRGGVRSGAAGGHQPLEAQLECALTRLTGRCDEAVTFTLPARGIGDV